MKRTLTLLLGLWVFTAPAVCSAICGDGPTPTDRRGAATDHASTPETPAKSCHRTAGDDRNERGGTEHPAPLSDANCCAEGRSDSSQIETPKVPLDSFAHVAWTAEGATGLLAHVATKPPRSETDPIQSPYLRANPPLLI